MPRVQSLSSKQVCAFARRAVNSASDSIAGFWRADTDTTSAHVAATHISRRTQALPMALLRIELRCRLAGPRCVCAGAPAQRVELRPRLTRVARTLVGDRQVPRDLRREGAVVEASRRLQ